MSVHETEDNILRSVVAMMNKANMPQILMGRPTLPSIGVSDTGGSLTAATYTYQATALNRFGDESQLSAASTTAAITTSSGSTTFSAGTKVVGTPRSGSAYRIYRTNNTTGVIKYYDITAATWEAGFTDTGATTFAGTTITSIPFSEAGRSKYAPLSDYFLDNLGTATVDGLMTALTAQPVHETEKNYIRQLNNMVNKMNEAYANYPTNTTLVLTDANVASAKAAAAGSEFSTLRTAITGDANTAANVPSTQDAGEQAMA